MYGAAAALAGCGGHAAPLVPSSAGGSTTFSDTRLWPAQPLPKVPILGEVRRFDGAMAPSGWALCDGSSVTIRENPNLFKILGKAAGGDGRTTFALPKARHFSRVIAVSGAYVTDPKTLAALFQERVENNAGKAALQSARGAS